MYSLPIAYLLWFISGFGALGLHRFYLGKIGTGVIWIMTGGLAMLGSIYDFFTLPQQVREAKIKAKYRQALEFEEEAYYRSRNNVPTRTTDKNTSSSAKRESIEQIILKTAKKNNGVATPSEVALEGNIPVDKAKEALEKLVSKGFAEMQVRKSGVVAYCFPEFMDQSNEFVDFS